MVYVTALPKFITPFPAMANAVLPRFVEQEWIVLLRGQMLLWAFDVVFALGPMAAYFIGMAVLEAWVHAPPSDPGFPAVTIDEVVTSARRPPHLTRFFKPSAFRHKAHHFKRCVCLCVCGRGRRDCLQPSVEGIQCDTRDLCRCRSTILMDVSCRVSHPSDVHTFLHAWFTHTYSTWTHLLRTRWAGDVEGVCHDAVMQTGRMFGATELSGSRAGRVVPGAAQKALTAARMVVGASAVVGAENAVVLQALWRTLPPRYQLNPAVKVIHHACAHLHSV